MAHKVPRRQEDEVSTGLDAGVRVVAGTRRRIARPLRLVYAIPKQSTERPFYGPTALQEQRQMIIARSRLCTANSFMTDCRTSLE